MSEAYDDLLRSAASIRRLARSVPRVWSYPWLGLALSLGAPLGYLVLRAVQSGASPTLGWLRAELATSLGLYVYMLTSTAVVFVLLGRALGRREDRLEADSTRDALTGLANLAGHRIRLGEELARVRRYGGRLSLLLVDVDRLKQINDRFGHGMGDATIKLVAQSLRDACRATDHPARIGGDEFAVLTSGVGAAAARTLAERIQARLAALSVDRPIIVSVSIGIAELGEGGAQALRDTADKALYESKAEGRNRISLAPVVPMVAQALLV